MPIYEYVCQGCGQESELLVASERYSSSQVCPHCGSENLERKLSTFASVSASSKSSSTQAKPHSCGKFS